MNLDSITNNHDIAIALMNILEKEFGANFHHSQTIFSADKIEMRSFVDVMNLLLYLKSKGEWYSFSDEMYPYINRPMSDIKDCKTIFERFLTLIDE